MQEAVRFKWGVLSRSLAILCLCGMVFLAWLLFPPPVRDGAPTWQQGFDRAEYLKQIIPNSLGAMVPEHIAPEGPSGLWQAVNLPYTDSASAQSVTEQAGQSASTIAWYRFTLTPSMPANDSTAQNGFYLPGWKTQGRLTLYQNGVRVWCSQGGVASQKAHGAGGPLLFQLPFSGVSVVVLRMDMLPEGHAALTAARAGSYTALAKRYRVQWALQYGLPSALAIVLLSSCVFLYILTIGRNIDKLCHSLIVAAVIYAGYLLFFLGGEHFTYVPVAWVEWGTTNALCWLVVVLWLLCGNSVGVTFSRLKHLWLGGMALGSAATLPLICPDNVYPILAGSLYTYCWIMPFFMLPTLVSSLRRRRDFAELLLLSCTLLLLPGMIHDAALAYDLIGINQSYLMPYLIPLALCSGLYLLGRRYTESLLASEQATERLQSRFELQETALRESYERLRQVEQRDLLSAERQRLMRDMHDGLGSTLTGAIHMTNGETPHTVLRQTLQDCLYDLKITVDSLESVDADLLVLLANLRYRLAPRFQAHGMTLEWSVTAVPPLVWLTPSAALHILRILQEVIANIIKHAQADRIRIATAVDGQAIIIIVEDNGNGFSGNKQATGGRGLHNIRWRAQAINSRAKWSALAKGTRFTLWMPIQQPDGSVTTLSPGMSVSALKNF